MKKRTITKAPKLELPQDFKSVAKRLGCDPNMAAFDAKLKKIAKAPFMRRDASNPGRLGIRANVDPASTLHTDGAPVYRFIMPFGKHEAVDHGKLYARDGETGRVHCNTAEGYFSLFKRGLVGTYQHMSEQHLPRYLAEFDFRMSNRVSLGVNDTERMERAIQGAPGKRLTYHQVDRQAEA